MKGDAVSELPKMEASEQEKEEYLSRVELLVAQGRASELEGCGKRG
jgi:hypothetical protein